MKNEIYSINDIYGIIRDFYISNFPYEIDVNIVDIINREIQRYNKKSSIIQDGGEYLFDNPEPTQQNRDPFFDDDNAYKIKIEHYYNQKENIVNIFNDVEVLHEWLINNGFIRNDVATEKMLSIKALQS